MVTIQARIILPEGTKMPEQGRAFTLPSGEWVKPFVTLELNDEKDLSFKEIMAIDCDIDECNFEWEEA